MQSIKKFFAYKLIFLGLSFGMTVSAIASEQPIFEAFILDPANSNKFWLVSTADPNTKAVADLVDAERYLLKVKIDEFFSENEKLAKRGDSDAQLSLGLMYQNSDSIPKEYYLPKDYYQAFMWFEKSAKQGNSYSQGKLGLMYYEGKGVLQDTIQATEWYSKSCDSGNENSCYRYKKLNE
ncbi:tetratricopeptide repeat protein [Psychrobacter nivimaris]|uniref:tetratricopeptide repeat protein n=1 Tax=Psychrobacter nivimaris TaxID=281738 RepID=UPI003736B0BD